MKSFKTDIFLFLGLLILTLILLFFAENQNVIDLQLHDTYFVIDKTSLAIAILGPLTFLVFLVRGLLTRFKATGANLGLIIGIILVTLLTYQSIGLQKTYLHELINLDGQWQDKDRVIQVLQTTLYLTWGLLGVWIVGVVLLVWRVNSKTNS